VRLAPTFTSGQAASIPVAIGSAIRPHVRVWARLSGANCWSAGARSPCSDTVRRRPAAEIGVTPLCGW